ncbi:hypothetical protein B879_04127 [Cecembia lonarensis LW9]|uniref:Uncharacterized protein n=1 Tax=Cecembia lonarensis (strain CCUG 58316 / KCTC 22772 / LW9) TaxID=1225176 RepID=K1LT47_CECL9|nr:hypothetical protein B879_04127 [Cecembia lonarensis LW9]
MVQRLMVQLALKYFGGFMGSSLTVNGLMVNNLGFMVLKIF